MHCRISSFVAVLCKPVENDNGHTPCYSRRLRKPDGFG